MARLSHLARRAWQLRHDRQALVTGLNRVGIRVVPGAGRYETRSPRVGRLIDEAWAGHQARSLSELEQLAARGGREGRDAVLALADWEMTHREATRALDRLAGRRHLPRDGRALLAEARQLTGTTEPDALHMVNARLRRAGFTTVSSPAGRLASLTTSNSPTIDGPFVTVIVPAFNSGSTITGTLTSLLNQTWRNLEIVVIDDASTDSTFDIVNGIADQRVSIVRHDENRGAYAARNHALGMASGEFITVNDADDWAHPSKIAVQVQHLLAQPEVSANTTDLVRVTDDLRLVRRGLPHGKFVGYNHASLMLRTETLRALGGWDDVRVGADSELEARLVHLHGSDAVARLHPRVPLTLARSDSNSLTGNSITGLASSRTSTGARRLYTQAYTHWHRSLTAETAHLDRADDNFPFPAPSLIRRRSTPTTHFDVIILSDLALPGGTTASNLAEIAANERAEWRTGLVHNPNPKYRDIGVNPKFFDACSERTRLLSAGEHVSCDVLVVKYPPCARRIPDVFPSIDVRREIVMIANQTPWTGYTGDRELFYEIPEVDHEIARVFGRSPLWYPIGPAIRHVFEHHHADEMANVRWAGDDWFEIIDASVWRRPSRPHNGDVFRVGRHGRDSVWKWPSEPDVIRAAYPGEAPYVIDILGGADEAKRRLGRLPNNWTVQPFDSINPVDFLARLDAFVHVAHPDMEEAFGRTILEALAVGVPVITEPRFAGPFGDAVIACDPHDVRTHLDRLRTDANFCDDLVRRGLDLVEARFGFSAHHRRVDAHRR